MGILNVTPDSFSDGGRFKSVDAALVHAESMIAEGADIIDIGGESTRPGSTRVDVKTEINRVVPLIEKLRKIHDVPISIDTSKADVAMAAIDAGGEIINDISGLRWDPAIADLAADTKAGLILMHSRGEFETMHSQEPVDDIVNEVKLNLHASVQRANERGVTREQIVLDVGIGFGKSPKQNLELLAKLDMLANAFPKMPLLVGASRKSFIGRTLGDRPESERLFGSLAAAVIAVENGAKIIRVHDVKESVDALKVALAIREQL
jgi:dihydropteroate synthase